MEGESFSDVVSLPAQQEALRARCYHPTEPFLEFPREEIEQSIAARFEDQVRKHSHRLAVKSGETKLTYDELNQAANRAAHAILSELGEGQEQVALLCGQSTQGMAGMLGVLKAGKIYVPLDPAAPKSRNEFVLSDAQVSLIVADDENISLARSTAPANVAVIHLDTFRSNLPSDNPHLHIPPDRLSYLMYTSGSTGEPKGVAQNHRNVLSKVMGWVNVVHISPGDRLSMLRAFHVSGSIRDLFGGLLCGAAVLPYDVKREGFSHLASWLVDEKITIYNSVVTLFRSFGATLKGSEDFSTIRLIKLSGEPVYKRDVDIFKKYFADSCLLVNMLAMAEVGSARVYFMGRETPIVESLVPIGYPLEDCEVRLLDADGNAAGLNQVGEIAIKSRYLSPGYWRRTDLTEAAFLPDPQGGDSRIFRTGDLGSMLSDGCLVHRGRKDSHVKIRGYSVEVVEVQAALIELDGVQAAVVTTRENSHGEQILVAYVVPGGQAALDASFLRKTLAARLPDYMVPSVFVFLESLPLAGPGKIDLRALPTVGRERPDVETPFAFPRTPVEKYLTKVWAQLLDLDQVGIHDDFLELGGDSLLASRLICQVRDVLHVEVPIRSLFETPTVAEIAVEVERNLAEDYTPDEIDRILSEVEGLLEMTTGFSPEL